MPPIITVDHVVKTYDGVPAVRGVSFAVEPSELTVIIGPSGCGKSTLLRCLNGLESFDSGMVRIGAVTIDKRNTPRLLDEPRLIHTLRQSVGMVFQSFNLFPHLTALQNVMIGPSVVQHAARSDVEPRARELLAKVGLADRADHFPHQLSGGQQQRCAIARALAMKPAVMLYDEPTSALDPSLVNEVLSIMKQLDDEGMTQVVVTHEMRFARQAADRVIMLHDGVIAENGAAEQVFTQPASVAMREFIAHLDALPSRAKSAEA